MLKKLIKNQKGQALVELALVLPVLLLLLLGIMECGRLFAGYIELQNASRDGARYASVHTAASNGEIENYVKSRLVMLDNTLVTVSIDDSHSEWIEIGLDYPMDIITPLIGGLIGDPVHLKSSMSMRVE